MKQFLLLAGSALLSVGLNAQVGINTKSPKATLDLVTKTNIGKSLRVENTSGDETFTVTNTGLLGIRNSAPEYGVDVVGNNATNSSLRLTRYATGIAGPHISLAESKGSLTSPQPVEKGNYLGEIWWKGYDGKKFQGLSFIMSRVEGELQEGKTIPSSLMFYTTDYDTPETGRNESMIINPEGKVGIGVEHPAERLEVKGSIKSSALAGVGTRNVVADANGKLMVGESQGVFVAKNVTTEERNAIKHPMMGQMVFNTDLKCLQVFNGTYWSCTDGSNVALDKNSKYNGPEYVKDRNFGDGEHDFVYKIITAPDGKKWLNNNLGADYANIHSPVFNPDQQSTNLYDYHAYGSLFEWQRKADGHELINWTGATEGTPKYGTTDILAKSWENAGTKDFIKLPEDTYFFTNNIEVKLWQAGGANNPCPQGFHVPLSSEIPKTKFLSGGKMTRYNNGEVSTSGPVHFTAYYLSDLSDDNIPQYILDDNVSKLGDSGRGNNLINLAYSVRCIQD